MTPPKNNVRFDCVQVFAAAGPLAEDGADLAFLTARVALSGDDGAGADRAGRAATGDGAGAKAGRADRAGAGRGGGGGDELCLYQLLPEMAHVHFGLRKLAIEADRDHAALIEDFRTRVARRG